MVYGVVLCIYSQFSFCCCRLCTRQMSAHLHAIDALALAVFEILCCVLWVDHMAAGAERIGGSRVSASDSIYALKYLSVLCAHLVRTADMASPLCCCLATALSDERASVNVFIVKIVGVECLLFTLLNVVLIG